MVVLSVALCTKGGKPLISRQFVEMTRIRIEALLAAFPKLINHDVKQQHTYVETDSVRYVYLPLDSLYLLLITNRASNIVEDLETIKLISKLVPNITGATGNLSEDKVLEFCFDLLFAFDEVLTAGGYREPINLQQIRTNMDMDSHEEKLHNMIKQTKMESAKDQSIAAAKAIKEKQRDTKMAGMGSGGMGMDNSNYGNNNFNQNSYSSSSMNDSPASVPTTPSVPLTSSRNQPVKGMSLGGGPKTKAFEDALFKEDKLAPIMSHNSKSSASEVAAPTVTTVQHPVMLAVTEKVSAKLSRDGLVESLEVKGNLNLTAMTDDVANCTIKLRPLTNVSHFSFTTHPKMNKALYDKSSVLQLKDQNKGFPSGRPVGILKWTNTSSNAGMVPIKINCWPEEEGRGMMNVNIEYAMDLANMELHDVKIHIPLGTSASPNIASIDGTSRHNSGTGELVWELDMIDKSNSSGSLEFTIQQKDANAFFPITVHFASKQLYCPVDVTEVLSINGAAIMYGITKGMSTEEYTIA